MYDEKKSLDQFLNFDGNKEYLNDLVEFEKEIYKEFYHYVSIRRGGKFDTFNKFLHLLFVRRVAKKYDFDNLYKKLKEAKLYLEANGYNDALQHSRERLIIKEKDERVKEVQSYLVYTDIVKAINQVDGYTTEQLNERVKEVKADYIKETLIYFILLIIGMIVVFIICLNQ